MVLEKRIDGFLVQTSNKLRGFEFERLFSTSLFLLKKERLGLGVWESAYDFTFPLDGLPL